MKTSIGKNTLGGGKKMTVELRNYNRSTHDLSSILRTSIAPGTLVPTFKQLVLPGDTFPIKTRCHVLTHPTVGPLFGSFKLQNDYFFCPIRLYNAMLHNNTLGVGLDMSKVKFPYYQVNTSSWDFDLKMKGSNGTLSAEVNPSSLPFYLGQRRLSENDGNYAEIGTMLYCMYFDIFKNYYANKQEDKFYVITGSNQFPYSGATNLNNTFSLAILKTVTNGYNVVSVMPNIGVSESNPTGGVEQCYSIILNGLQSISDENIEIKINATLYKNGNYYTWNRSRSLTEWKNEGVLEQINLLPTQPNIRQRCYKFVISETAGSTTMTLNEPITITTLGSNYKAYDLKMIDQMRENILMEWGTAWDTEGITFITDMFQTVLNEDGESVPNCHFPQCGLALKTYQSDINTNWIKTEWIDGDNGINAITAIDTSSGSFTLDTLNLAKKVYDMLNRIAISDGSYNAWIQTVYTSGGLNHIETPLYIGGTSTEIEFQEVISNSATEDQPLGSLAGRGIATNHKGGEIRFKADEPGYIMCISSITPRVDYFQGNDYDVYLRTMNDLHKPQLDGIGFQDRLYRNINASSKFADHEKSVGKQPAWIEYMTNVNKTAGNFALIENEGWMCLNRIFGDIETYTTYIQPHLYNTIFADTDASAQNFWLQIYVETTPRRVMSAKQIPNV